MQLKTKDKIYEIEFTFEAAESETIQTVFDYFSGSYMFKGMKDSGTELEKKLSQMDSMIGGISSMPKLAIDFLLMGLLEHHGEFGDKTQDILSRDDAKRVYKEFCKENPDDAMSIHSGLFDALKEQMEADGFFKRIGLEQMMEAMNQVETEEAVPMKLQDHKKPQKKAIVKA